MIASWSGCSRRISAARGTSTPSRCCPGTTARRSVAVRPSGASRAARKVPAAIGAAGRHVGPVSTVSVHVSNLLAKLGVSNRGEAVAAARRLHLLDDA